MKDSASHRQSQKKTIVAGVDVGSLYAKTVIADIEGKVLSSDVRRSGSVFAGAAAASMAQALRRANLKLEDLSYVIATGYGRDRVPFANEQVTELTCHARGARHLFPEVHTVVDIGGQDSKVIQVANDGAVVNFIMNDKCAAGTGRFLEVMSAALETTVEALSRLYFQSRNILDVSSMCTVFAETEVISLLAEGCDRTDITAGLFRAIARRVAGLVGQIGLREEVVMSGGVSRSRAMVDALAKALNIHILVPEEPQIVGALGAAILAAGRISAAQ